MPAPGSASDEATTRQPDYTLGHSEREVRRLEMQASLLAAGTERVLRAAGLGPGMTVLDIGTGAGDVAMLAADLVGPSGSILGVDREAGALERARAKAAAAGFDHVHFEQATLESLSSNRTFDFVVGRYLLIHQEDCVALVRQAAARVRPGGILAFMEPTLLTRAAGGEPWSHPPVPLFEQARDLFITAFDRAGVNRWNGAGLVPLFLEAGLPEPRLLRDVPVMGPTSQAVEWLCSTLESLLPTLARQGVTTAAAVGIDTLPERMQTAVSAARSQVRIADVVGAWARIG